MPSRMVVMQRALFCFQCLCTVAYSRLLAFLLEVGGADGCRLRDVLLEGRDVLLEGVLERMSPR